MVLIYVSCGVWRRDVNNEWKFIVDNEKKGRLLSLEASTTVEQLKMMVLEDFGMEEKIVSAELSYFPSSLMSNLGIPPVVISNDRQVCNFIGYRKKNSSIYLCVSFTGMVGKRNNNFDLNEKPSNSIFLSSFSPITVMAV
ncbi:unnamed protein product [Eruca vesicaria subsp. sativa]|uniref:Uncharacterized protein n=1 Tax=Eruca vesicaria subsp. sativa TaxID=29727 RepID=A0ABC8K9G7_ERUVS|nr:unnamed protein product [Eruca vesicaria subsp. sativa]